VPLARFLASRDTGNVTDVKWLSALRPKCRRGSLPRCLLLTAGTNEEVAARLTNIVGLDCFSVSADDFWMPRGLPIESSADIWDVSPTKEPKLGEAERILSSADRSALSSWWLEAIKRANTPNWDIASTCSIRGVKGLLLIEAKAHEQELRKEEAGKSGPEASEGSRKNHERIGKAIGEAREGLERATDAPWGISRDCHYQMSNRFAWSWKLAELGHPVALVYLGFLNAPEMADISAPLRNHRHWEDLVRNHSANLCPPTIWGHSIEVNGSSIVSLIRSVEQPLRPVPLGLRDDGGATLD
jgi:hypothetical protein